VNGKHLRQDIPIEFEFANDAFALVPEYTEDGARTKAELDAARIAKEEQDKAQLKLPNTDIK
jgi:hypothetical protein